MLDLHDPQLLLTSGLIGLGVLAAVLTAVLGRLTIPWLVKRKLNDGEPRKASEYLNLLHGSKKHTPTMGGVFLVPGLVVASCAGALLLVLAGADAFKVLVGTGTALFVLLAHAGLGLADDYAKLTRRKRDGISGRAKLVAQTGIALLACTMATWLIGPQNASLHVLGYELWLGWGLVPLGTFVMVGASNAYNLTDGLDGLAGGTGAIAFHALAIGAVMVAGLQGTSIDLGWTTAMVAVAGSGALLGFLFWNRHPARVFMGDTGSLSFGAVMGFLAVLGRVELLLAIAGGVFVAEAGSVMLQVAYFKLTRGKRIFRCAPLHHHFQFGGWHETRVTRRFVGAAMVLAAVAIALLPFFSPAPRAEAPTAAIPQREIPKDVMVQK
ncbi:MAG: phospho-N-acetylmuramoyl-pentapeptide-transferase [Planctomycetes bacterium]|nr:phospho-N-acetylmuramoyl-pentapeptide-transferase [Planctomycetota bacterium]